MMTLRRSSFRALLLIVLSFSGLSVSSSDFYEWTDENGVKHFATSIDQVPAKYRDQVKPPDARSTRPGKAAADATASPAAASGAARTPAAAPGGELERFEVPYRPSEGSAKRVILPVTFNDKVTAPIALDTGSPGMVISLQLAARLGLLTGDRAALVTQAAGIGGSVPAILTVVDSVSVGAARSSFVPTTVTQPLSDAFEGLIGMDFLSSYTVTIDPTRQVVVFEKHAADPNARGGHDEDWWRATFRDFRSARDRWQAHARSTAGKLAARDQAFVDFQVRESERLLRMLDVHASNQAVPRHWR